MHGCERYDRRDGDRRRPAVQSRRSHRLGAVRRQDHHLLTETTGVDNRHRWVVDAASYDTWFDQPWGAYASTVEHQLLLDAVSSLDGLRVCDAGCGTGRFAARLEAAGACVTGVDRDPAALAIASTRLTGDLVEGDVQSLPFADGQFDVTFAVTVCEFTADPAGVVAELARITRPGGHVVIGSLNPHSPWGRWTRRRFRQPPWDTARFLDRAELDAIASHHGAMQWRAGLYAPTALPGLQRWGPLLDRAGCRLAPNHAAFEAVRISLHDPEAGRRAAANRSRRS
jgi:SAM-dependent methyltransferase